MTTAIVPLTATIPAAYMITVVNVLVVPMCDPPAPCLFAGVWAWLATLPLFVNGDLFVMLAMMMLLGELEPDSSTRTPFDVTEPDDCGP